MASLHREVELLYIPGLWTVKGHLPKTSPVVYLRPVLMTNVLSYHVFKSFWPLKNVRNLKPEHLLWIYS